MLLNLGLTFAVFLFGGLLLVGFWFASFDEFLWLLVSVLLNLLFRVSVLELLFCTLLGCVWFVWFGCLIRVCV